MKVEICGKWFEEKFPYFVKDAKEFSFYRSYCRLKKKFDKADILKKALLDMGCKITDKEGYSVYFFKFKKYPIMKVILSDEDFDT